MPYQWTPEVINSLSPQQREAVFNAGGFNAPAGTFPNAQSFGPMSPVMPSLPGPGPSGATGMPPPISGMTGQAAPSYPADSQDEYIRRNQAMINSMIPMISTKKNPEKAMNFAVSGGVVQLPDGTYTNDVSNPEYVKAFKAMMPPIYHSAVTKKPIGNFWDANEIDQNVQDQFGQQPTNFPTSLQNKSEYNSVIKPQELQLPQNAEDKGYADPNPSIWEWRRPDWDRAVQARQNADIEWARKRPGPSWPSPSPHTPISMLPGQQVPPNFISQFSPDQMRLEQGRTAINYPNILHNLLKYGTHLLNTPPSLPQPYGTGQEDRPSNRPTDNDYTMYNKLYGSY